EIAKLYSSDVEAYALLVLNISREISRRLRVGDDVLASMGMTAEAMWSDAVGTTTHPAMPVVTDWRAGNTPSPPIHTAASRGEGMRSGAASRPSRAADRLRRSDHRNRWPSPRGSGR